VVECLPNKHEALNSSPITAKKEKRKKLSLKKLAFTIKIKPEMGKRYKHMGFEKYTWLANIHEHIKAH
jgi:hypothetical protein